MASPFRLFRKNQKLFLALAAGMAMFVFVLADPLSNWLQQVSGVAPGQASNKKVAEWDGGSINEQELSELTRRRYFVSAFLRNLQMLGGRRILDEGGQPTQPTVPNFILNENPPRAQVEADVVTRRIFAKLAKEAGISISDQLVNHYLNEIGFRRVTGEEIQKMLASASGGMGARAAEEQLFSGIHEMLLGEYYLNSYGAAIQNVMPEQRWQDWLQINRRIAVEAAILPASQFLDKTEEPSDEELKQFYESNKDRIVGSMQRVAGVQLPSPNPGFKEPRRVKLQYLQGDVTAWTEKLLDTVTEEEIADYYERNKRAQFVKAEDASVPADEQEDETPSKETEEATEEGTTEPETEEAPENAAEEEPKPAKPVEEEPKAEESAPEEPAEEPEATTEEPSEPSEEPAAEESSSAAPRSPFRLAAFQEEGEEAPSEEENPAEKATTEGSNESTEEGPVEESTDASSSEAEKEPELDYVPLAEVSDQIRRQLANDKAVVELQRVMELAYAELQSEYNRYGGLAISAESQGEEPPAVPAKLADLSGMAKKHGLVQETMVERSVRELEETDVGKAVDTQTRSQRVAYAAFTSLQVYEPFLSQDIDGQWYLVLKTEDIPARVPELEEIRDRVVKAWKQGKAAEIAFETAQQLAKEAQEAGGALAPFMADKGYEVVTTDLFSSRTFGTTPNEMRAGARLGEAPPLNAVGIEFMEDVFKLEPEQAIALQNNDHSDAYVVRLDRREKTEDELRQLFLSEANSWYGGRVMMAARMRRAQQQLQEQLHKRTGFDYEKFGLYLQEVASQ